MKDGDTTSMGTLESVLHVRQQSKIHNQDQNSKLESNFSLRKQDRLHLPAITKANYDDARACIQNTDKKRFARDKTLALLSRLNKKNYAGSKNIEGALRIPCAPLKLPDARRVDARSTIKSGLFGSCLRISAWIVSAVFKRPARNQSWPAWASQALAISMSLTSVAANK